MGRIFNMKALLRTKRAARPGYVFLAGESSCTTKVIVRLILKQPISLIISSVDDYEARQDTARS